MSALVFLLSSSTKHTGKHPGPYCPGGQRSQDAPKVLNERDIFIMSCTVLKDMDISFPTDGRERSEPCVKTECSREERADGSIPQFVTLDL
ncbi:uncharacterized [Tachysurus ichikawai]